MPAPQAQALFLGVIAKLPIKIDTYKKIVDRVTSQGFPLDVAWLQKEVSSDLTLIEFVQVLCGDITVSWGQWQDGLLGGSNNVNGLGIGAWIGSGDGGKLTQNVPFNINHTWSKKDPEGYFDSLKSAITADFKEKFEGYASSFSFATVPYIGVCTATPISPGPFFATNIPAPLMTYKSSAKAPKDLAKGIRDRLPGKWSENPEPLQGWLKALEGSVIEQLSLWETSSQFVGDTVTGTASPGAGTGSGTSLGTGKIT